jgi:PII-like signaling protein
MENNPAVKLLRIFLGESDKYKNQPLYEVIVFEARKQLLSGATVVRGIMGFGASSQIHTAKLFDISSDLPIVIEIVDSEEKINRFLKTVDQFLGESNSGALVTIEKAEVIRYRPGKN